MRARRSRSTVLTAATLGALLATGAVLASPAAYAADAPAAAATASASAEPTAKATSDLSLQVNAPQAVGRGGEPVEFTETVGNSGATDASFTLRVGATTDASPLAYQSIKVEYRDADGTWKPLTDTVPGLTVAAGAAKTVQLRLTTGLHAYWTNPVSIVKLSSAVLDATGGTVLAESTKDVSADYLTMEVGNAPTTAVIGGAPVEFDVTIKNPSESRFTTVAKVVTASKYSTLQMQKADGSWETLTGTSMPHADGDLRYLLAADQNLAPGETFTRRLRLSYNGNAPIGTTYVNAWADLDPGTGLMHTLIGPQYIQLNLTGSPLGLSVQEPSSIGNGGKPVEFTETVTNASSSDAPFNLKLDASNPAARSAGRIALESRAADGTWKPVGLTFTQQPDGFHFIGSLGGVIVPANSTKTVQLRLAAPLNNDWAGQSGTIKLSSTVLDQTGQFVLANSTKDVALKALDVQTKGAPTTAVLGGTPAEFDVTFANPSASAYDNVSEVVQTDRRSTLQVQKADGSWEDITGIPTNQPGADQVVYHLTGDKNLAAGSSITRHVRLGFTADAPIGRTYVNPAAVLGEGSEYPATVGPQGFPVDVTATQAGVATKGATGGGSTAVKAGLTTTDGTAASGSTGTSTGTSTDTADVQSAGGVLAHTGSDGMLASAAAAAGLLASGIGALFFARRRRSA
ncbi:LPXTG cell wall anchor domain-containing protein [Kitasatospora sp. NPDC094011]|uniref:LPXTG cell wall anchor domain-containing protein n=1 Tax=Kitasatospora sp. NPDC094011 TaxID=3364090 RepID=UPI0037F22901